MINRQWLPSGLRRYLKSSRENALGPRFKSPLVIMISIEQSQKWLVTIQIVGHGVTCVAYNIKRREKKRRERQRFDPSTLGVAIFYADR